MKGVVRQTSFVDPFGDLKVGLARVVEQFGQVDVHGSVLGEQQPFEHCLVDRNHLLQISTGEVHGSARILSALDDAEISWVEANYAAASKSDGASQEPSIRNMTAVYAGKLRSPEERVP